jgi:hypothetical protein
MQNKTGMAKLKWRLYDIEFRETLNEFLVSLLDAAASKVRRIILAKVVSVERVVVSISIKPFC